MIQLLHRFFQMTHIDPRIYELEKKIDFYQYLVFALIFVIVLLIIVVVLQRKLSTGFHAIRKKIMPGKSKAMPAEEKPAAAPTPARPAVQGKVTPKELPDPGLIFKFSLAQEHVLEKLITIGQTEGNIKTFSTEIMDNHLSVFIRIIEGQRDRDIYEMPDIIVEEYQLDLRRDGKTLIYYPGLEGFREMGSRERIYVRRQPDEAGDPTFPSLEPKNPVRFRVGDRLNQDGKFTRGYFEFHLFTQDYEVKTKANIPKVEKNFLIRLYKIYPGYDTGAPTDDGLYPMIDPFTTG